MMSIRQAILHDMHQVADVSLASMLDDPAWHYRYPWRLKYSEDHQKYNRDLIRRFISPDYEDWVVMVADTKDPSSGASKVVALSVWDLAYVNQRKCGPAYKGESPLNDTSAAGGSSRKDVNAKRMAAFRKGLINSTSDFLMYLGPHRMTLQIIATLPDFRHQGFASSLVRWGMKKANYDGVALTLNTNPQGAKLLKARGFRELRKQKSQVPGEKESIVITAMEFVPKTYWGEEMELLD